MTLPMMAPSHTHVVLIASYNSGSWLLSTVKEARSFWAPVWVVVDGSDDGSHLPLLAMNDPHLRVIIHPANQGKGSAIFTGAQLAAGAGFTHALTMDADGQHAAGDIANLMAWSQQNLAAMILGVPVFAHSAPRARVRGRKISNWCVRFETQSSGIGDCLFGFRVYPLAPMITIMMRHAWMRRFDFDIEIVVRLSWAGVKAINYSTPVRYYSKAEGGVSHFKYLRDNVLLTWMHTRLFVEFLFYRFWTFRRGR